MLDGSTSAKEKMEFSFKDFFSEHEQIHKKDVFNEKLNFRAVQQQKHRTRIRTENE